MNLTNYERETIINFNEGEDTASVYTHNRPLRRRLEQLAQDRPDECRLVKTSHDGEAAEYYVPKRWVRIAPPRQARPLSDEERAAAGARLNKAKLRQKTIAVQDVGDRPAAGMSKDTSQPTPGQNAAVDAAG